MGFLIVGAAMVGAVVVAGYAWTAKEKRKQRFAVESPFEKVGHSTELLKELRMKAYL